jgi:hypothetical protein
MTLSPLLLGPGQMSVETVIGLADQLTVEPFSLPTDLSPATSKDSLDSTEPAPESPSARPPAARRIPFELVANFNDPAQPYNNDIQDI